MPTGTFTPPSAGGAPLQERETAQAEAAEPGLFITSAPSGATVEIDGKDVYAMHQIYTTKSDEGRLYENHKEYVDVQYVLEGTEIIRVTDAGGLSVTNEYNSENDVALFALADGTDVKLGPGDFVVLFPHDAHVPQLMSGSPDDVKKIVIKVRV